MKVAIIHNQFKRAGGMEAYMLALVRGFHEAGDEVHVHTYKADRQLTAEYPCVLHTTFLSFLPRRFRKYAFIRKYNRSFDRGNYDVSLSLTRTSCQDIAVCGGVHPAFADRVRHFSPISRMHDRIEVHFEKKMLATVPFIMAHSRQVGREIREYYGVEEERIRVMYPPIDTEVFRPLPQADLAGVRQRYAIRDDRLTFLIPSGGHRTKGLPELLDAFARLDPERYELLIAGRRTGGQLPRNVRHVGYIDNLAPLYAAVDFMILPSHYEAFGLVVVESLACGTPVIVTRVAGAAELLSPGDGIVLPDNRTETLAATISGLKKNRFQVTPDFAIRHGLTIPQHIAGIKKLVAPAKAGKADVDR